MEVGIETNDICCCCLVTTLPSAMVHLVLMLKNGAGGDMSAHARGCRLLMWVLDEKDVIHHLLVSTLPSAT